MRAIASLVHVWQAFSGKGRSRFRRRAPKGPARRGRLALLAGISVSLWVGTGGPSSAATFVPPGMTWRTIKTPHFDVNYPIELEPIARKAAVWAENAYERYAPYFGRTGDRTEVTILDTMDTTNGFGTAFPESRLTFFATPPSPDEEWYVGRYDNWLKMIVSHEYWHVMQARATAGPLEIPGYLNAMFTRAFLPDFSALVNLDFLPPFLKEGMAVYQESLMTGGGRALEGQFDMVLRMAFLAHKPLTLDQVAGYYSLNWAPGAGEYVYGEAFCQYLARKYGDSAGGKLTRDLGQFPWGGINLASVRAFGKSLYGLWDDSMAYYTRRYEHQAAEIRQLPLTSLQPITSSGRNHRHPHWLNDHTLLYNRWPLDGTAGLVERRLNGSAPRFLVPKRSDADYSLSADGRYVYFYADGDSPPDCEYHDIFRYDMRSGAVRQITHGLRASFPCPSPDGKEILVVLNGGGRNDLAMIDDSGKVLWRIREPLFSSLADPVWSPDGTKVALSRWIHGRTNVVIFDVQSHEMTVPAPDDAVEVFPAWSRDGKFLLFASDRTGVMNIHAVRLFDGARFQVTNVLGGAFDPSVSPDGKTIALADYGAKGFDIKVMPYDPASWMPESPAPTANALGHALGDRLAIVPQGTIVAAKGPKPVLAPAESLARSNGSRARLAGLASASGVAPSVPPVRPSRYPTLLTQLGLENVKYLPSQHPRHDPLLEAAAKAPSYPYNPLDTLAPQLVYPRLVMDTSVYPGFQFPGLSADLNGGGALLALQAYGQDALHQHFYFATLGIETAIHQPFVSLSYANDVWAPTLGIGVALDPSTIVPLQTNQGIELFGRESRSLSLSATYPAIESTLLDSWITGTHFTLGVNLQNFDQVVYNASNGDATSLGSQLLPVSAGVELPNEINSVSLSVQSNSAGRPYRPISDVGGPLWAAGVENANPLLGSQASYTKAWGDVRYFVPTFGRQVLALRVFGGTSFEMAQIDKADGFRILQPEGWVLGDNLATASNDIAYGLATSAAIHDYDDIRALPSELSTILPVRGYSLGVPVPGQPNVTGFGQGANAAVMTAEYRMPLLDVSRGLGTFPVFLDRVSLAPFVDMAKAWTVWNQSIPLVGVGAEVRFHLEVVQAIPTELRLGYARGLTDNLGANQIILGIGTVF